MSLSAKAIEEIKGNALAAISRADSLDSLKEVKLAHVGDKSPIAKANQQLASLSADERATFGKVVGQAKNAITLAFDARTSVLELERDARVLIEERVDVSIPANRTPK